MGLKKRFPGVYNDGTVNNPVVGQAQQPYYPHANNVVQYPPQNPQQVQQLVAVPNQFAQPQQAVINQQQPNQPNNVAQYPPQSPQAQQATPDANQYPQPQQPVNNNIQPQ